MILVQGEGVGGEIRVDDFTFNLEVNWGRFVILYAISYCSPLPFWKVGIGTFGRVFRCWDPKRKRCAAVKVVRNVPKYSHSSLVEAEILKVRIS